MFGIPLIQLIGLAVQYGPQAIKLCEALEPIIAKAAPLIEKEMQNGKTAADAGKSVAVYFDGPGSPNWETLNNGGN